MADPLILARAVHLAASALMAGALAFDVLVARPLTAGGRVYRHALASLIWGLAAVVLVSGLVWLWLLSADIAGAPVARALTGGTVTTVLTETRFGNVWLIRGGLVAAAMLALSLKRKWPALILSAAALAAIAITAHAGARDGPIGWGLLASDMLHLVAAGLWLGSLPALAILLAAPDVEPWLRAAATRRFSGFGIVAVAILIVSGFVNAWAMLGQPAALIETSYGRILSIKLALFAAMLACAAANRLYWTPRLPDPKAFAGIVRLASIEIALGLGIMLAVGALGTMAPPFHVHAETSDSADGAFVHIHDIDAMAEIRALPGVAGANSLTIRLLAEDFTPFTAARAVSVRVISKTGATAEYAAESAPDDVWQVGKARFDSPGVWTVTVLVRLSNGRTLSLDGPLVIETKLPPRKR
jgi:putative copper resistance protein D